MIEGNLERHKGAAMLGGGLPVTEDKRITVVENPPDRKVSS
jgi:hypothetical protein